MYETQIMHETVNHAIETKSILLAEARSSLKCLFMNTRINLGGQRL